LGCPTPPETGNKGSGVITLIAAPALKDCPCAEIRINAKVTKKDRVFISINSFKVLQDNS
jgi:hypothetical protein